MDLSVTVNGQEVPVAATYKIDTAHSTVGFVARHLVVSKVRGEFRSYSGEIVVLKPPTDPSRNYIKRVVATPGQRVAIRSGHVYVNGLPLAESYLRITTAGTYGPVVVPAHEVFVLGDNRGNSEDSRAFGFVPDRNLVGEAILIYWPPSRAQVLR